jgi:hypothetical protein
VSVKQEPLSVRRQSRFTLHSKGFSEIAADRSVAMRYLSALEATAGQSLEFRGRRVVRRDRPIDQLKTRRTGWLATDFSHLITVIPMLSPTSIPTRNDQDRRRIHP